MIFDAMILIFAHNIIAPQHKEKKKRKRKRKAKFVPLFIFFACVLDSNSISLSSFLFLFLIFFLESANILKCSGPKNGLFRKLSQTLVFQTQFGGRIRKKKTTRKKVRIPQGRIELPTFAYLSVQTGTSCTAYKYDALTDYATGDSTYGEPAAVMSTFSFDVRILFQHEENFFFVFAR